MINGISNFELSANTEYLTHQIDDISPSLFSGCIKTMLILGSGDGKAINEMAGRNPDWSFTGVDFNPGYVEIARAEAPTNVEYLCQRFDEVDLSRRFGVVASCGLLSWISDDDRDAVYRIAGMTVEKGGYCSFGFDNEFFWGELKGIRETFLALWIELGSHEAARMLLLSMLPQMKFSSPNKAKYARHLVESDRAAAHWLYQKDWKSMFPSEVISRMYASGFSLAEKTSLTNICLTSMTSEVPYIHWRFVKQ